MTPPNDYHETNRRSWNEATKAHNSHKGDQAAFFRNGGTTIYPEEIALLGDIRGKDLVHLQCNAGQDTLSIASKLGAVVTGVDISDEAVDFARKLSAESGIPAIFHRSDIFDWFAQTDQRFDVAFSSYGAIGWLSDLTAWGHGIASILRDGGRFVLVEFHPVPMLFEADWSIGYDYSGGTRIFSEEGVGDYVAETYGNSQSREFHEGVKDFVNPNPVYEFCWGLADVIGALLQAGLKLETFEEYPYSNGYSYLPEWGLVELDGQRWTMPDGKHQLPLMYGIAVRK